VADEIGEQIARPAHAALQHGEAEGREALHHAADDEGLGEGVDVDHRLPRVEAREFPFVAEALAAMDQGGYPEALARVAAMIAKTGEPLPLSSLQLKQELMGEYADLLPSSAPDEWRRIRGEQEIIVRYEPEAALATLPKLLADPADRQRLVTLVRKLLADARIRRAKPSPEQLSMLERVGQTLRVPNASRVRELADERAPAKQAAGARDAASAKDAPREVAPARAANRRSTKKAKG